jgi:hypothetical protein
MDWKNAGHLREPLSHPGSTLALLSWNILEKETGEADAENTSQKTGIFPSHEGGPGDG